MKNVTVTLPEEVAAWARVEAARLEMSLSRFIGAILEERMGNGRRYLEAMRKYFAQKGYDFSFPEGRYPKREELHDRARLR